MGKPFGEASRRTFGRIGTLVPFPCWNSLGVMSSDIIKFSKQPPPDDVLYAIEDPDYIMEGYKKALIALKKSTKTRFLAVVYKEVSREDGFVITAYFTSKLNLEREVIRWQKKS
jgi:hypothetical protein